MGSPVGRNTAPLRLPGFRVAGELGRSGVSVVYLAEDLLLARRVAVKVLHPAVAAEDRMRGRFLREFRTVASLQHPHVLPVYGMGEAHGTLYAVLPYVPGADLGTLLLEQGPLPPARAAAVIAQLASALDHVHAQGLVHRDVKPQNVLVDTRADRYCYLVDFGLATAARTPGTPSSSARGHLGSLGYGAPEQLAGFAVDHRADVHGLGGLLFACLTGLPLWEPEGDAVPMGALDVLAPAYRAEAAHVIATAMAADHTARYDSCGAVAAAVAHWSG